MHGGLGRAGPVEDALGQGRSAATTQLTGGCAATTRPTRGKAKKPAPTSGLVLCIATTVISFGKVVIFTAWKRSHDGRLTATPWGSYDEET